MLFVAEEISFHSLTMHLTLHHPPNVQIQLPMQRLVSQCLLDGIISTVGPHCKARMPMLGKNIEP